MSRLVHAVFGCIMWVRTVGYSDLQRRNLRILSTNNLSVPLLVSYTRRTRSDETKVRWSLH
jgi:hypothetical protein